MGKATPEVQVPGAPAAQAAADNAASQTQGDTGAADLATKDREIAALRAQLAAQSAPQAPSLVMEADGPNYRRYRAESKHNHLTTMELHEKVLAGEVKVTDHHVLCKDGWYVPSASNAQANG